MAETHGQPAGDTHVVDAVAALTDRQMLLPALLFVAGHRPLAFALGQMLLLLQPLATVLGGSGFVVWSQVLSDPARLEDLVDTLAIRAGRDNQIADSQDISL